ncbi:MAG: phosphate acyltransferase PlsX, partial [Acidobacteria bacterium]|nr:phosphate acyltransferase PlsX [Acidobacteriota bacterium]
MLTIALDAMGGDAAPRSEIEGALQALEDFPMAVLLIGPEVRLRDEVRKRAGTRPRALHFLDAPSVIEMDEPVAQALRRKRRSSIHVGMRAVQEGRASAFVSAGNTGAIMALAKLVMRTLPMIDRPALAAVLPTLTSRWAVLLDVGANSDCKPHHLVQFAMMGDIYARSLLGVKRPRVGQISIGEEEAKGNDLTRETYKLLEQSGLNFVGNVEGRDICTGETDVLVCDGFTGNVILKTSEGILEMLLKVLRQEMTKSVRTQVGALLSRPAFQRLKNRFDYAEFGGVPLLGVRHTCII